MSQFFKFVFASCLGVILAGVLVSIFLSVAVGNMVSRAEEGNDVTSNSILELSFKDPIPEKSNNLPVSPYDLYPDEIMGLQRIVETIHSAKEDKNIKGIFMDLSGISAGRASSGVIRDAILDFKESGKFVTAYSKYYSQGSYYLASAADKVYVNPIGGLDFRGFSAQIPFFKDMLDRLGVKMQIYYAGQFKSATEPFRLNEMSDQNRFQVKEYLNGMYKIFLQDIADSRNISTTELRNIANELKIRNAEDAVKYKLADAVGYRDEVYTALRERLGFDEKDKLKLVSMGDYAAKMSSGKDYTAKDKVAVVYAEGSIVDGKGERGQIGGDKYASLIRKLRKDDKVKAIVLRINSGGGSVIASDIIWRELLLARQEGKPVVASMGDVAASGGYYIACLADSIFAEPSTITGSIGVFGMIPSLEKTMKDKMGVDFDTVTTGKYATGLNLFMDISEGEGRIIQSTIEEIYETFLTRVADGRKMSRDEVHKIAQGRVWTGEKALEIGLVDKFGGVDAAVASAAKLAGLEKYRTGSYPVIKEPIQELLEDLSGTTERSTQVFARKELGELYPFYEQLVMLKNMKGVQARLPFVVKHY